MKKRHKWPAVLLAVVFSALALAGCGGKEASGEQGKATDKTAIKVGVTPGPHAEIMEVVKKKAAEDGLKIEIIEFSDYIQPNVALNSGEIDVNSYQHQPFLDEQVKDRGYKIETLAKTVIFPMGVYSKKFKSLDEVKDGAIVSMPNDPSNSGRALMILEKAGLLKLKDGAGTLATVADIQANPKHLQIKELEAAQVPLSLADVDLAVINTNYAVSAGLVPTKDALLREDGSSPYANILVVQSKEKELPVYRKLVKAYHSDEVKQFVNEHFKGAGIAAW